MVFVNQCDQSPQWSIALIGGCDMSDSIFHCSHRHFHCHHSVYNILITFFGKIIITALSDKPFPPFKLKLLRATSNAS